MFIKKKNLLVVSFSSVIIATVFVATLVGYNLYLQWKKDAHDLKYRNSIYRLTADMFRNDVVLSDVDVKLEGGGSFQPLPFLEGSIKNNANKPISSLLLEISFTTPDNEVLYNNWVYPLGERDLVNPASFAGGKHVKSILLPGEGITFRHILRNCPPEVVEKLSNKSKFARDEEKGRLKMSCSVAGMSVL